jgi:hypothetical protein
MKAGSDFCTIEERGLEMNEVLIMQLIGFRLPGSRNHVSLFLSRNSLRTCKSDASRHFARELTRTLLMTVFAATTTYSVNQGTAGMQPFPDVQLIEI